MAILIDLNQFMLAAIFKSLSEGFSTSDMMDENVVRHILLNQIRSNRVKFKKQYGEVVICCDSKNTWRKEFFPYYKIRRNRNKQKSDLDWSKLYDIMGKLKKELKEHFPYKVIEVELCEADDIIGTIAHTYGDEILVENERILILSRDKDYKQLLKYTNVEQFDQIDKKFLRVDDPREFLQEMIITGDSGDDIPNILSEDTVFALGVRQKPITKKRMESFKNGENITEEVRQNIKRNIKLIDLSKVPSQFKKEILEQYEKPCENKRGMLMDYFFKNGLTLMLSDIGDF